MSRIKLTKNELRDQEHKLSQLQKYLPTLQLKKAMLQGEVNQSSLEISQLESLSQAEEARTAKFQSLLSERGLKGLLKVVTVKGVTKGRDSIAGVEFPTFEGIDFDANDYPLFNTPLWWDRAIAALRALLVAQEKVVIAKEKNEALRKELRDVSIRVNLFEKILIPRHLGHIKKIKIFLGDQQLSAVAQAKAAKRKILEKRT